MQRRSTDRDESKPRYEIALAVVYRGERWLVAQRRADAHLGELWEFPGGKCLADETAAAAALRELLEECAVRAIAVETLKPVTHEYADRVVRLTPVLCRWVAGQPQPRGSAECRWVSTVELESLAMPEANAEILAALATHLRTKRGSAR